MTKPKNRAPAPPAGTEPKAPAVHVESKAKFVTIASKLPMNLIIQLCAPASKQVTGRYGPVEEVTHVPTGESFEIRGTAYPVLQTPKGFPKPPEMIEDPAGGYALTKGIPGDFAREWFEQNATTDMVKNGVLKMQADLDSLAADAKDHANLESGLGPMNPDLDDKGRPLDRRSPRPINTQVSPVQRELRASA